MHLDYCSRAVDDCMITAHDISPEYMDKLLVDIKGSNLLLDAQVQNHFKSPDQLAHDMVIMEVDQRITHSFTVMGLDGPLDDLKKLMQKLLDAVEKAILTIIEKMRLDIINALAMINFTLFKMSSIMFDPKKFIEMIDDYLDRMWEDETGTESV